MAAAIAAGLTPLASQPRSTLRSGPAARHQALAAAQRPQQRVRRQQRCVCAAQEPEGAGAADGKVQQFTRTAERMFQRYDFLSAGMGALAVTGFCVARGQDPGTALWITAASTVVALLVNEFLPTE